MLETKLKNIAKSYDRHFIEHGKKDALDYDNLPEDIIRHPDYPAYREELDSGIHSSDIDIKEYLSPKKGMNFISLGCGVNLIYKKYDEWPSTYHGVDISSETIRCLNRYVEKNDMSIGSLHCGSIHDTPFDDSYFDIGECIGAIEYYKRDFVEDLLKEFHRILKPGGEFVLDIPNSSSPSGQMAMMIEACMGRPDEFDLSPSEFEDLLCKYFIIEDSDIMRAQKRGETYLGMMCFYCLRKFD